MSPRRVEEPTAFTFPLSDSARIVCTVLVGTPPVTSDDGGSVQVDLHEVPFKALWDTGSAWTMVVPKVIRAAKLKAVGFRQTRGIDGTVTSRRTYHASVATASNLTIRPGGKPQGVTQIKLHATTVVGLERDDQLGDIDMLIGMDIIGRGDMALSTDAQGTRWMSYLHPTTRRKLNLRSLYQTRFRKRTDRGRRRK